MLIHKNFKLNARYFKVKIPYLMPFAFTLCYFLIQIFKFSNDKNANRKKDIYALADALIFQRNQSIYFILLHGK